MKLGLDTNRYVDLMRGDAEVRALVEGARTVLRLALAAADDRIFYSSDKYE